MAPDTAHDPKTTATYRALKAAVIILGALIMFAFGALVVGGVMKAVRHRSEAAVPALPPGIAALPAGAKIVSLEVSGNRVVLGLHTPEGDEVDIFDTDTGRLVARLQPAPGKPR